MADPLQLQALQVQALRGGSGASPESMKVLASDPDLDKGLYPPAPAAPLMPSAASKKAYIPPGKSAEQQAADRQAAEIARQWGISFPREKFPGTAPARARFMKEGLTF